jgi:hypothetical protein
MRENNARTWAIAEAAFYGKHEFCCSLIDAGSRVAVQTVRWKLTFSHFLDQRHLGFGRPLPSVS